MYNFMRKTHLYAGLLWVPWMLVYATSGLFINHREWFEEQLEAARDFKFVEEREFEPGEDFPHDTKEQAKEILAFLDLEGPFNVPAHASGHNLTINRPSAGGAYRILWQNDKNLLVVRRQPFTLFHWLARMHFMAGYQHDNLMSDVWAVTVDVVTISMWFWVLSGIYLWYKIAKTRTKKIIGGACVAGGLTVFGLLAWVFFG